MKVYILMRDYDDYDERESYIEEVFLDKEKAKLARDKENEDLKEYLAEHKDKDIYYYVEEWEVTE